MICSKHLVAGVVAGVAYAGTASAAQLDLRNVSALWMNSVGGASVVYDDNPGVSPSISWGNPLGGGQSGYDFATQDPVPVPAANPGEDFTLGVLTHRNAPISVGTSISAVDLQITTDIFLDGTAVVTGATFGFSFAHNETPNAGSCPVGQNPCADIVTASLFDSGEIFRFGGIEYTLMIEGFRLGDEFTSMLVSNERTSTSAEIVASLSATQVVPVPAAGLLLLGGLGGLGAFRGLKRKRASV